MPATLKKGLNTLCMEAVELRISNAQSAIDNARESANDDTKSSAGDKHETGRAMAQLEQEKAAHQLYEALELKKTLEKVDPAVISSHIQPGSIVLTDKGNFFISIPIGKLVFRNVNYFAISLSSPVGQKLKGLKQGDQFEMNSIVYKILDIL